MVLKSWYKYMLNASVFPIADTKATAKAIFDAVTRFHHPAHSDEWNDPQLPERIDVLIALLLRGVEARRTH